MRACTDPSICLLNLSTSPLALFSPVHACEQTGHQLHRKDVLNAFGLPSTTRFQVKPWSWRRAKKEGEKGRRGSCEWSQEESCTFTEPHVPLMSLLVPPQTQIRDENGEEIPLEEAHFHRQLSLVRMHMRSKLIARPVAKVQQPTFLFLFVCFERECCWPSSSISQQHMHTCTDISTPHCGCTGCSSQSSQPTISRLSHRPIASQKRPRQR